MFVYWTFLQALFSIDWTNIYCFLDKPQVKKTSSQEYDDLNMDGRVENVPGTYRDLCRNTQGTAGILFFLMLWLCSEYIGCS